MSPDRARQQIRRTLLVGIAGIALGLVLWAWLTVSVLLPWLESVAGWLSHTQFLPDTRHD